MSRVGRKAGVWDHLFLVSSSRRPVPLTLFVGFDSRYQLYFRCDLAIQVVWRMKGNLWSGDKLCGERSMTFLFYQSHLGMWVCVLPGYVVCSLTGWELRTDTHCSPGHRTTDQEPKATERTCIWDAYLFQDLPNSLTHLVWFLKQLKQESESLLWCVYCRNTESVKKRSKGYKNNPIHLALEMTVA